MAHVLPFPATVPARDVAELVSAPPYDVVNAEEATVLADGNPLSFLRVSRPEIELPPGTDAHGDIAYAKGAANYERLKATAPMVRDAEPHYYIYSLVMNGHRQTGVVATPAVDDYDNGVIKKHEKTRQDKEDDRTRHILTLSSQTGPVFLTYPDNGRLLGIADTVMTAEPLFDFVAPDGIAHTIWRVPLDYSAAIQSLFETVPALYIADGHHRAAGASRARAKRRDANPGHTGHEEYNRFLCVIFPSSQLRILPYNRVIEDLNGRAPEQLIAQIGTTFNVCPCTEAAPSSPGNVCMYLGGRWYAMAYKGTTDGLSPVDSLDVSLLQANVLAPLLGIDDPRTSCRIDFVGGIRGTAELEKRVDSGEMAVAFSMFPTTVEQLMAISDADQIMPPKSTWFEPKLRDGLLAHDI